MTLSMPMSFDRAPSSAIQEAGLALRLAQRAFSALVDAGDARSPLARAQRRQALRCTLSALSADDRDRFARWLTLLRTSRQGVAPQVVAWIATPDAASRRIVRRARAA